MAEGPALLGLKGQIDESDNERGHAYGEDEALVAIDERITTFDFILGMTDTDIFKGRAERQGIEEQQE